MARDILLLGAGALNEGALIKQLLIDAAKTEREESTERKSDETSPSSSKPAKHVFVTELRQQDDLSATYNNFATNYQNLTQSSPNDVITASVHLGIDATELSHLPKRTTNTKSNTLCREDLSNVSEIIWFSPYFGKENEARFPEFISNTLKQIVRLFTILNKPIPSMTFFADGLGLDGIYNLQHRFNFFDHDNWQVQCLVNHEGAYRFAASKQKQADRALLANSGLQSDAVIGLRLRHGLVRDLSKRPLFFCSGQYERHQAKCSDQHCGPGIHYTNIHRLNVISLKDMLSGQQVASIPFSIAFDAKYNCYSVPTHIHPKKLTNAAREWAATHNATPPKTPERARNVLAGHLAAAMAVTLGGTKHTPARKKPEDETFDANPRTLFGDDYRDEDDKKTATTLGTHV